MLKLISRATLASVGILPFSLLADAQEASSSFSVAEDIRVIAELQSINKNRIGGSLDVLVPIYGNNQHIFYINPQSTLYDRVYQTYGVGLGYRRVVDNAVYGFNAFYDKQRSENKNYYDRATVGFERLSHHWDVRTNFYFYFNQNKKMMDRGLQNAYIKGTNIFQDRLYETEKVDNGFNVELGHTLGLQNLRGYIGYYTYGDIIHGASARLNYEFTNRISFTASTQYDQKRSWLTTVGVKYWLGKERTNDIYTFNASEHLRDQVVRDMTVPAYIEKSDIVAEQNQRNIYFASSDADNSVQGSGAADDPISLDDAFAKAGAYDIIYLENGTHSLSSGNTVKANQIITSGASDLVVDGFTVKTATGNRATITGSSLGVNSDGSTLSGIDFSGNGTQSNGLSFSGGSNVTVSNTTFGGSYANSAIAFSNGANSITLNDITIAPSASLAKGVDINDSTGITFNTLTLSGVFSDAAVSLDNGANNNTFTTLTIAGNSGSASAINLTDSNSNTFTTNTINGTYSGDVMTLDNADSNTFTTLNIDASFSANAITMTNGGTGGTFTDTTISNGASTAVNAIAIDNATGATFNTLTINDGDAYSTAGVFFDNGGTATINSATITNTDNDAIELQGGSTVTLTDSTLKSDTQIGLNILDGSHATVSGSTLDENGLYGINIRGSSSATVTSSTFNNNSNSGVYVRESSTLTLNDSESNNNTNYGLVVTGGGVVNTDSTTFNSNKYGISTWNSGTAVTITGTSQVNSNTLDGLDAKSSSAITMTGGTVSGNLGDAVEVQSSATVTLNSLENLNGIIFRPGSDSSGDAKITVDGTDEITSSNQSKTCSTTAGITTCS